MSKVLEITVVSAVVFGPGVVGTGLWLYTGDPVWNWGWVWTLIVLLAG